MEINTTIASNHQSPTSSHSSTTYSQYPIMPTSYQCHIPPHGPLPAAIGSSLTPVPRLTNRKFLPLREITLNSRPLVKRAIQFSSDGELAVTADDSVHVFVPEFPDLSKRRSNQTRPANGHENGPADPADSESSSDDEADRNNAGPQRYSHQTFRAQYSEGSKHMPVSYPPLDPRVNKELFTVSGIPFPYEGAVGADAEDGSDDDDDGDSADSDSSGEGEDDGKGGGLGFNQPYGAGYGPITGVGSSMNHVVCIGWSPSGLGVNRRPILAVLTGSGTLAMYGDSSEFINILPRTNEGMLQRRELGSWIVLWGVGERLVVPGQQTEISEYIRGFAWAREMGPGQALLATINDMQDVAIISVQSVPMEDETKLRGDLSFRAEPRETVVWLVREIARFKAEGPHTKQDVGHRVPPNPKKSFTHRTISPLTRTSFLAALPLASAGDPGWRAVTPAPASSHLSTETMSALGGLRSRILGSGASCRPSRLIAEILMEDAYFCQATPSWSLRTV